MTGTITSTRIDSMIASVLAFPGDVEFATLLGMRAVEVRREVDALPALMVAERASPRDAGLLHIIGLVHRSLGDSAAAIATFDRAATLGPPTARLAQARAHVAMEAGRPAADLFAEARRLAPMDATVIQGHAAALQAEGRPAEADALLARVLTENPGWIEGHGALARMRFAAGRADFTALLDAAIAGAPLDQRLWQIKIALFHRAGMREVEAATIAAARAKVGTVAMIVAAEAMLATELGDGARADAAFAQLDVFADSALTIHMVRHLLRQGRPERIIEVAETLVTRPDARDLWPYLTLAWRLVGDPRAALIDDPDRFVRVIDLAGKGPSLDTLANTLRSLHIGHNQPLDQSVRGGTQTDGPLFARVDPDIRALRAMLEKEVLAYRKALPPAEAGHPLLGAIPASPRFIGSWSVRLGGGGHHDAHIHTQGWLSSAFYVTLPETPPGSTEGWLTLGEPQPALGLDLAPYRLIEPKPGRLVLFPSTMWHGTRPFGAGERMSVAFDIG